MPSGEPQLVRRLAWAVALICLWCGTGAALHHTEDMSAFRSFVAGRDVLRHAAAAPGGDACAACEWQQAVPTLHPPVVRLCLPPVRTAAGARRLASALHLIAFDHFPLRAPPVPDAA